MKLTNTEKLFLKAYYYNWDDGISTLQKIIENKDCDKGTSLLIYWLAKPSYYNKYHHIDDVIEYEKPVYKLIKRIEELVLQKKLPEVISYTPDQSLIPKELGLIPKEMLVSSKGNVESKDLIENNAKELKILKACEDGDLNFIKEIINSGFNIDTKINGSIPIEVATQCGQTEIVKYLILKGAKITAKTGPDGFTLLHWACQAKHLEIAKLLIENGLSINEKAKWGRTVLHQTAYWDANLWEKLCMDEVLLFLLENGANRELVDTDGNTALDLAVKAGNNEAVKILKK